MKGTELLCIKTIVRGETFGGIDAGNGMSLEDIFFDSTPKSVRPERVGSSFGIANDFKQEGSRPDSWRYAKASSSPIG
jgi:hypothetical protein